MRRLDLLPIVSMPQVHENFVRIRQMLDEVSASLTDLEGIERTIAVTIAGFPITTGSKAWSLITFDSEITGWKVLADGVGSIVIDVRRGAYSAFPTFTTIVGSAAPPSLTSAQKNAGAPTGWVLSELKASDLLEFYVSSVSSLGRVTLFLTLRRK